MEQFDAWGTRHVGLFTFAHSAKHDALAKINVALIDFQKDSSALRVEAAVGDLRLTGINFDSKHLARDRRSRRHRQGRGDRTAEDVTDARPDN
jgi:hypothetical protein